ncbi:MAG: hypothetical protein EOO41_03460 [Methanobacteriota archaeon]|nr:MAG: hypothetical protein EOO41_03460 [Euryarchaeota archaeon]
MQVSKLKALFFSATAAGGRARGRFTPGESNERARGPGLQRDAGAATALEAVVVDGEPREDSSGGGDGGGGRLAFMAHASSASRDAMSTLLTSAIALPARSWSMLTDISDTAQLQHLMSAACVVIITQKQLLMLEPATRRVLKRWSLYHETVAAGGSGLQRSPTRSEDAASSSAPCADTCVPTAPGDGTDSSAASSSAAGVGVDMLHGAPGVTTSPSSAAGAAASHVRLLPGSTLQAMSAASAAMVQSLAVARAELLDSSGVRGVTTTLNAVRHLVGGSALDATAAAEQIVRTPLVHVTVDGPVVLLTSSKDTDCLALLCSTPEHAIILRRSIASATAGDDSREQILTMYARVHLPLPALSRCPFFVRMYVSHLASPRVFLQGSSNQLSSHNKPGCWRTRRRACAPVQHGG